MEFLKSAQEVSGISQNDLARILGISLSLFKQYKTGRLYLRLDDLRVLSSISAFNRKTDHQNEADVELINDTCKNRS